MKRLTPPLFALFLAVGVACGQDAPSTDARSIGERDDHSTESAVTPALDALYEHRQLAGFGLMVNRAFIADAPDLLDRVLLQLKADLDEVSHLVPEPALAALRKTTFWIELQGATNNGMSGRGMCCHWSAEWLASQGLPREKAGGVEVINPEDFLAWRRSQPYMTLHELSHAYHRMLGMATPEITETYRAAMDAGLYEQVARNSVPQGNTVRAYAATNPQEYFAEVSEAYFALNDFAPYSRAQLAEHDPAGLAMAETLWNLSAEQIAERIADAGVVGDP